MTNHLNLRDAVRLALTAGVVTGTCAAPVHAEDDDAARLDRVEVTGSRIKRTQLEGAMPVTSVTREQIEKTGISSIGDLLQELPAAGAALNTNFNNGGDGSTRIDLRNLGANRVLVLVNGRRWVAATGGAGVGNSVDLNTIPLSIIERIEVLKDGASAVYGSDAIAGVVNIITRRDFDGASANATIAEFDEGDGRQELYDFSIGASTARSSAFMNVSYYNAGEVAAGDRKISAEPLFGTGVLFGSSATPNGRFLTIGTPLSDHTRLTGGDFTPSLGDFIPFVFATHAYNYAPDNYLATPSERTSLYAQGRHDITDNVTFTTEALYNQRRSEQLLAAMPVTIGAIGSLADGNPIGVDATNPFNVTGQNLDPTGATGPLLIGILRRFVETGGRSYNQDVNLYRFGAGLEGNFEAFGRLFDWNVGYTYTTATSSRTTYGQMNTSALATSLGPIAACQAPCVPLNLFGGAGSITRSMLDFVSFTAHDTGGYDMRNYTGNLSGEIFDLPAGPVGLAVGYEYRKETAFDEPDALITAGNTTDSARTPTRGGFSLTEFYGEVAIPVLSGMPFAEVLELQVAARSSDYDTFGSTTNTKFGFRWQPMTDLLVRGTFQEGFRAPSVTELFSGQGDSFPTLPDPCSAINAASNNQLIANCTGVTTGGVAPQITGPYVPTNGSYVQVNPQIRITVGGNPALNPETAESTTFGFVYSPGWVDGLSVTLDWYEITLDDAIQVVGANTIMTSCYTGGVQQFCDLITRLPSGNVDDLLSSFVNVSTFDVSGIDLNVVYRAGEIPFLPGEWKFTWDTAYVDTYEITAFGATNSFVQFNVGDGSLPAFKSNLDIEWSYGDWEAVWRMRFVGRQYEACTTTTSSSVPFIAGACSDPVTASSGINALGATTYHNVQVSYHVSDWDTRITFGIQNLGDKSPPQAVQSFANSFDPTTYEIPGRFPYFRISKTF